MKFNEIKRETKRRIYALALASIMVLLPKTKAYAAEVDMSTKVDIDHAISVLVPDDKPSNNNGGNNSGNNDNNNGGNNSGNNDNNNDGNNSGNNDNNNDGKDDNKDNDDENKNENEEEKCDHSYVSVDVTNQKTPSCTVAGSYDEVYQCSKCGATKTEHHSIPAPGHKWDGGTRVETKDGYDIIYHCTNKGCSSEKKTHHSNTPDPTEPTKPHKPTNPSDVPKTGDDFPLELMEAVCGISALGLPIASYQLYKVLEEEKKQKKQVSATYVENEYKGKYLSKR